jgi:hypothetical protein
LDDFARPPDARAVLKRVVRKVLGRDWVPDESEEETAPGEDLPNGDQDG